MSLYYPIKTWAIKDPINNSSVSNGNYTFLSEITLPEISDNNRRDFIFDAGSYDKRNNFGKYRLNNRRYQYSSDRIYNVNEEKIFGYLYNGENKTGWFDKVELSFGPTGGPIDLRYAREEDNNYRRYLLPSSILYGYRKSNGDVPPIYPHLGCYFPNLISSKDSQELNKKAKFTLLETSVLDYIEKYKETTTNNGIEPWEKWTRIRDFQNPSVLHYQIAMAGIDPYQVEIKIERKLKKRIPKNNLQSPDWQDWEETILPFDPSYLDAPLGSRLERIHYVLHVRVDPTCVPCFYYDGPSTELPQECYTAFEELLNPFIAGYQKPSFLGGTKSSQFLREYTENDGRDDANDLPIMPTGQVVDNTSDFTKYSYNSQFAKTNPSKLYQDFVAKFITDPHKYKFYHIKDFNYQDEVTDAPGVTNALRGYPTNVSSQFLSFNINKRLAKFSKFFKDHLLNFTVNTHDNRAIIYTDEDSRNKDVNELVKRRYPLSEHVEGPSCIFTPLLIDSEVAVMYTYEYESIKAHRDIYNFKGAPYYYSNRGRFHTHVKRFRIRLKPSVSMTDNSYKQWTNDRSLDGDLYLYYSTGILDDLIYSNLGYVDDLSTISAATLYPRENYKRLYNFDDNGPSNHHHDNRDIFYKQDDLIFPIHASSIIPNITKEEFLNNKSTMIDKVLRTLYGYFDAGYRYNSQLPTDTPAWKMGELLDIPVSLIEDYRDISDSIWDRVNIFELREDNGDFLLPINEIVFLKLSPPLFYGLGNRKAVNPDLIEIYIALVFN